MKKIGFSTVLALVLVASLLGAPGSAAPKQIEGSFTAQANPLPHAWFDPARPCGGRQTRDPASYVDHELTAPFSGWFAARMSFEQGDWDLSILGSDLEPLAMSDHQEATGEESERLRLYLKRGQKVVLRACNFASTVSAEVVWSLVKGRGWAPVRAKAAGRIEEHSYISPAAAVGEAFVICHAYFDAGCTAFKPHSMRPVGRGADRRQEWPARVFRALPVRRQHCLCGPDVLRRDARRRSTSTWG
jgi:hypothetical protein